MGGTPTMPKHLLTLLMMEHWHTKNTAPERETSLVGSDKVDIRYNGKNSSIALGEKWFYGRSLILYEGPKLVWWLHFCLRLWISQSQWCMRALPAAYKNPSYFCKISQAFAVYAIALVLFSLPDDEGILQNRNAPLGSCFHPRAGSHFKIKLAYSPFSLDLGHSWARKSCKCWCDRLHLQPQSPCSV